VNDPTDVSNETYVASADILVSAESVENACERMYALTVPGVWCIECSSQLSQRTFRTESNPLCTKIAEPANLNSMTEVVPVTSAQ
jgi:hypothetical protein